MSKRSRRNDTKRRSRRNTRKKRSRQARNTKHKGMKRINKNRRMGRSRRNTRSRQARNTKHKRIKRINKNRRMGRRKIGGAKSPSAVSDAASPPSEPVRDYIVTLPPGAPDPAQQLRAELARMKLLALKKRAKEEGVEEGKLKEAGARADELTAAIQELEGDGSAQFESLQLQLEQAESEAAQTSRELIVEKVISEAPRIPYWTQLELETEQPEQAAWLWWAWAMEGTLVSAVAETEKAIRLESGAVLPKVFLTPGPAQIYRDLLQKLGDFNEGDFYNEKWTEVYSVINISLSAHNILSTPATTREAVAKVAEVLEHVASLAETEAGRPGDKDKKVIELLLAKVFARAAVKQIDFFMNRNDTGMLEPAHSATAPWPPLDESGRAEKHLELTRIEKEIKGLLREEEGRSMEPSMPTTLFARIRKILNDLGLYFVEGPLDFNETFDDVITLVKYQVRYSLKRVVSG